MSRIRFCHVIDGSSINPLLYNSIKYSDRGQFEYTVISLAPEDGLQEQMKELGVRSFSVDYHSREQAPSAFWRLYKFFRNEQVQVVQSHLFDASLIGLAAAKMARVPVTIFTGHHSHETPLYKRRLLTFVDGSSGRFLANYTIAPSEQMKEIFVRDLNVPERKIKVIHHGFDLCAWREKSPQPSNIRAEFGLEGKIVFGAVGRLFWVKDFPRLVEAFEAATAGRSDVVLLIIGGGDQKGLKEFIAGRRMNDKVMLTGRRRDIASVMNDLDVLIHSSLAESFGMVFIEAFALGKPIISTRVGVAPEIINDGINGFLTEAGDTKSQSDAILKMLAVKDNWKEMGENGKLIAENFAVRKTQAECDKLYLKWLQKK